MTKLQFANIREFSASLSATEQLSSKQLCDIKGGCSSCEDTRDPPGVHGKGKDKSTNN